MRKKTIVLVVVILALVLGLAIWFAYNLDPGSYPYAEQYQLNYSREDVKNAVRKFKQENPDYMIPKTTIKGQGAFDLDDGPSQDSIWYCIYFYYKQENQIVFAWLRGGPEKSAIALVSINDGLDLGHWKEINKDFIATENEEQKKRFEDRILNGIKKTLANN